jgi:magnesium chelatase accessory protein
MRRAPVWEIEGRDWPERQASRFIKTTDALWHVQIMGSGPVFLLLHGTGAATHSWRDLAPLLAARFTVVAPDLPGHGFSEKRTACLASLPQLAAATARLLAMLDLRPAVVAGHSAGAAILLRMALDHAIAPERAIALNGALSPFPGVAALLFPALAKMLFLNPFAAPLLARRAADPAAVGSMIAGTGSTLDARGIDLYTRLLRTERHLEATLAMMANWDLRPLQRDLPRLSVPLTLVVAEGDRAVPPSAAEATRGVLPEAKIVRVEGGHLAHEEHPAALAKVILREALPLAIGAG